MPEAREFSLAFFYNCQPQIKLAPLMSLGLPFLPPDSLGLSFNELRAFSLEIAGDIITLL